VGIFGTFTGYLANLFLSPAREEPAPEPSPPPPNDLHVKLEQLKLLMAQQQAAVEEIERQLGQTGDLNQNPPPSLIVSRVLGR